MTKKRSTKRTTEEPVLEVNTLVRHKKLSSLGIGCIAKVLKSSFRVNFGLYDTKLCSRAALEVIDTSKCKTISFQEFRGSILSAGFKPDTVILGNTIQHYVGIGWHPLRVVTEEDLEKYPRVI